MTDVLGARVPGPPGTAMPAVVLVNVLKGAGFGMILYLSALQNIPASLYEAAEIDGATWWQRFRRITLPLLRPITLFMVIVGTISCLNAFVEVYAMTCGGPNVDVRRQGARRDVGHGVLRVRHVLQRSCAWATRRRCRTCCSRSRS